MVSPDRSLGCESPDWAVEFQVPFTGNVVVGASGIVREPCCVAAKGKASWGCNLGRPTRHRVLFVCPVMP